MTYFREVSDLFYQSQQPNRNSTYDYVKVKNFFRRAKIRDDFFKNLTGFSKYKIIGEERPEQVSEKVYGTPNLDWLILISNNIINVRTEWPLSNREFQKYLSRKYTNDELTQPHHYETLTILDTRGKLILSGGLVVDPSFTIKYFDESLTVPGPFQGELTYDSTIYTMDSTEIQFNSTTEGIVIAGTPGVMITLNPVKSITNYEYEVAMNDRKRNIYLLKSNYIQAALDDMREIMSYGFSSQYVDDKTKRGENYKILSPR